LQQAELLFTFLALLFRAFGSFTIHAHRLDEVNPVIRDRMIPLDQSPTKEVRTAPAENQPMQDSCALMEGKTEKLAQSQPGNGEFYFVPKSEADFTQRKPR
jgi:hypothetical protein